MIEILKANRTHVHTIINLGKTTFIESHSIYIKNNKDVEDYCNNAFNEEKIKQDLSDKDILFWIIYYKKQAVGFAKIELNKTTNSIQEKNVCKLDKIYILNDFIGKKLGKKLHDTIIENVKKLKFNCIWLVTYIYNYNAISFYEANQYKKIGFYDFVVAGKSYKNHIMCKNLIE